MELDDENYDDGGEVMKEDGPDDEEGVVKPETKDDNEDDSDDERRKSRRREVRCPARVLRTRDLSPRMTKILLLCSDSQSVLAPVQFLLIIHILAEDIPAERATRIHHLPRA